MAKQELIEATIFCEYHQIEYSFINSLEESGLVEFVVIDQQKFIPRSQLYQLEKIIRLYHELDINLPGVEAIIHILQRMEQMQQEIISLKNKLRLYEYSGGDKNY